MFLRLGHDTFVCRHHQKRQIDPRCSRHHGTNKIFVSGNIDHARDAPMTQIQRSEVQLDRDLAPAFLCQPVHWTTGQGGDQSGFTVIDVTGCSYDHAITQGRWDQNSSAGSSAPSAR